MTTQSEPDGGVWQDRNGDQWRKTSDVWENLRDGVWLSWSDLCRDYGPLVPLIPDPGWEQDGEPVVCRVVWRDNENVAVVGPTGSAMHVTSATLAASYGLPLPPEPEPSLVDLLRNDAANQEERKHEAWADRAWRAAARIEELEAAARLRELEANSQSATSESQSSSSRRWTSDKSYEIGNEPDSDLVPVMLSREDAESLLSGWGPEYLSGRLSAAARAALEANPRSES